MTTKLRLLPVALAALLLTLSSCAREWYRIREEESVRVRTKVTVFTEPPGADVSVNGGHSGQTPIMIPIQYRYRKVVYARERSYVVTRDTEERTLPEYFANHFEITVTKPGYEPAVHQLNLRGEKDLEVHIPLVKRTR